MAYIFDEPIHYVVFTRNDNTWDVDRINKYLEILDKIEATEGPGVMVTIGTGKRNFSSGFDLPYWAKDIENTRASIERFCELMARVLEFSMPTLAIFNGNAIAGGLIWGLCHDSRIMNEKVGFMCLSELKLGIALPPPYMLVCRAKMTPVVCSKYSYAINADQKEGLKDGVIDDTYSSIEDLQKKIGAFTKRFAAMGAVRGAIKTNKQNQFESTIQGCRSFKFTPMQYEGLKRNHKLIKKIVASMAQQAQAAKKAAAKPSPKL